jgi:predicted Zn-dependent protease
VRHVPLPSPARRRAVALVLAATAAVPIMTSAAFAAGTEDGPTPGATTPAPLAPAPTSAAGASVPSSAAPSSSPYESAKQMIATKRWAEAIAVLTTLTSSEPGNADAWNLLGYATRKNGSPKAAIPLYAKALALNPRHRGALEYQGEAYVELRNLTKARANLAALKRICGTTCEEYQDLAAMIGAAGKKK